MTNDTETLTLADFLLARIAEDEAWAKRADARRVHDAVHRSLGCLASDVVHVDRHDPARVLAECEAKRRIVGYHYNGSPETNPERCSPCDTVSQPCMTLRALALPYADHPDYREEWKA